MWWKCLAKEVAQINISWAIAIRDRPERFNGYGEEYLIEVIVIFLDQPQKI